MIDIESLDKENPYEVLELKDGVNVPAKKIGKSFNRLKHRARSMNDVNARTKRLEQLEKAKDQLQRPDDRVIVDFSHLGPEIFRDMIQGFGKTLSTQKIDTEKLVKGVSPQTAYDELIPQSTDKMMSNFRLQGEIDHFTDVNADSVGEWFK